MTKTTAARKAARTEAKLNKSRAGATSHVSGPTFFEIGKRPSLAFFCDPETGDVLEFDMKTAVFS